MKMRYFVSVSVPREERDALYAIAERMACLDGWHEPWTPRGYPCLDYTFDSDDPRLASLREYACGHARSWFERLEHVYTVRELRSAPLLEFSVRTAERDLGGPYREQFDFSGACTLCGAGARQIAPLRVRPRGWEDSGLPTKGVICQTVDDYLVTEPLYRGLTSAKLRGLELMQVISARGTLLPWWQIIPRCELPPMASETRGITRGRAVDGCVTCGRDNWFHGTEDPRRDEPSQIAYRRSQLGDGALPDVAYTYECFGISRFHEPFEQSHIARGRVLVSPRVFDVFHRLRVKHARFAPVRIV